jgi:thioredoxin reductase (NADPH)
MTVAIIGAGPAGMSCANALLSFGIEPVVIERAAHVGGIQRANFHPNLWMLGMPGETGIEITDRLTRHYFELPIVTHLQAEIVSVRRAESGFLCELTDRAGQSALVVSALVLATGSKPRSTAELDALARRSGRVIVGPLSETIRDGIHGSRVLILGGGDNALDHALYLAERGNRVTVCARGDYSARRQFLAACAARPEIELRRNCRPTEFTASDDAASAAWRDMKETYDWLLVMYGYEPNTTVLERFDPAIRPRLVDSGHIHVERDQRTSVPRIYAVGDVTDCIQPSVPTAIAQGLAAAKAVEMDEARTQATQST